MNDSIDRQAAIDALRYAQHRFTVADEAGGIGTVKWSEDVIYFAAAERILTELPSAQPYTEAELQKMQDLYQAEIDKAFELGQEDARPEIIHCGECKHRDPEDHKCDCGHDILWQLPRDDRWYCADAERKEGEGDADALRNVSRGTVGVSDGNSNRKVRGENTR